MGPAAAAAAGALESASLARPGLPTAASNATRTQGQVNTIAIGRIVRSGSTFFPSLLLPCFWVRVRGRERLSDFLLFLSFLTSSAHVVRVSIRAAHRSQPLRRGSSRVGYPTARHARTRHATTSRWPRASAHEHGTESTEVERASRTVPSFVFLRPPPPQPPLQVPPISNLFFRGFFWFGFSQADSLVVLVRSVRLGSLGIGTQFPDWTHGDESVTAPSVDFFRVFRPFLYELMRFSHRQKCTRFCRRSRNR